MKILVLDVNYPHSENLNGDLFVHVRVKEYIAAGHDVKVAAFFTNAPDYEFDGVRVDRRPDLESLQVLIREFGPDVVAVHFFQGWMLEKIVKNLKSPVVVWVHGVEALPWYKRRFNFEISREFAEYVAFNLIQMKRFRELVRYANSNPGAVTFVFVSEWMRQAADPRGALDKSLYSVVHNPIDTSFFEYRPKSPEQRFKVLLVRSFNSRKYANDIAVDSIVRLSRHPEFENFQFTIRGRGKFFRRLTGRLAGFGNVSVSEGFLTHQQIRDLHSTHGLFLCPTRQDAQGVSMCEAMSSGLVPLTSDSSAIPEFVTDRKSGFLGKGAADLVVAMRTLARDPGLFERMSRNAADEVRRKCEISGIVSRELQLMTKAVENSRPALPVH
jgi:glycosyltransferase involved in cell wall biosynthesis